MRTSGSDGNVFTSDHFHRSQFPLKPPTQYRNKGGGDLETEERMSLVNSKEECHHYSRNMDRFLP